MSSVQTNYLQLRKAEVEYREAFARLKEGRPKRLGKGASVSQNNVAKEAGKDPSALKKARFPLLIRDIQAYVKKCSNKAAPSRQQSLRGARNKSKRLIAKLREVERDRDLAVSQLLSLESEMHEMWLTIQRLEADKQSRVVSIQSHTR